MVAERAGVSQRSRNGISLRSQSEISVCSCSGCCMFEFQCFCELTVGSLSLSGFVTVGSFSLSGASQSRPLSLPRDLKDSPYLPDSYRKRPLPTHTGRRFVCRMRVRMRMRMRRRFFGSWVRRFVCRMRVRMRMRMRRAAGRSVSPYRIKGRITHISPFIRIYTFNAQVSGSWLPHVSRNLWRVLL